MFVRRQSLFLLLPLAFLLLISPVRAQDVLDSSAIADHNFPLAQSGDSKAVPVNVQSPNSKDQLRFLHVQSSEMLLGSLANLNGQNASSQVALLNENAPILDLKDFDFITGTAREEAVTEHQNWLVHVQGTEIAQGQPGFHSPYQGTNSLRPDDNIRQSSERVILRGKITRILNRRPQYVTSDQSLG